MGRLPFVLRLSDNLERDTIRNFILHPSAIHNTYETLPPGFKAILVDRDRR